MRYVIHGFISVPSSQFSVLSSQFLVMRDDCDGQFFIRGESECTSEGVRGQFNIFGAIEEIVGSGVCRRNLRAKKSGWLEEAREVGVEDR